MLKLPWWNQLWFWLLIVTLVIGLIMPTSPLNLTAKILAGIFSYFAGTLYWLMTTYDDRLKIKTEKARLSEIKRKVRLFDSLTGRDLSSIPILEVDNFQIYYLLDKNNVLIKTTDITPVILKVIGGSPKNWLVEIACTGRDFNSKIYKEVAYGIGWAKGETKSWELLNHRLIDQDGNPIEVHPELGIDEIEKILNFTRKYRSAKEFAFEQICPYTAGVLESTKQAFGSPILEELRKLFENPLKILKKGIDSENTL